ncbi:MAG: ABC transporter ATP-binding protein [Acutalibacteraceae bacterium]
MYLTLKDIHKSFGEKEVLKGISFSAEGGKAFGLLGRNGAGKTTTIRILMNVFPANSGEVLIDGRPIDYSKVGIGYLPEERGLYPKKKISEQLIFFARLKGMNRTDAASAVDYWLGRLNMTEYCDKRLDTLSKGNQQKIQLVTAVAHNPDIVILDEPFSGLDPVNAMLLEEVVKEEIAKGKIVLFSSHQMNYIEEFCDSIAILNGGKAALCGELRDIKRGYKRNKLVVSSPQRELILNDSDFSAKPADGDEILITLSSSDQKSAVMRRLAEKYDLDGIKVFEPSLNDIFVEYAGERE